MHGRPTGAKDINKREGLADALPDQADHFGRSHAQTEIEASRKRGFFVSGVTVRISANFDYSGVERWAKRMAEDQVPFAKAVALTRTANLVRNDQRELMKQVFDRPTRFTLNSLFVRPATKAKPVAEVWLKDTGDAAAPQYLLPHIQGGNRGVKRFEYRLQQQGFSGMSRGWVAVPGKGAQLDAYGNMRSQQIMQIMSVLQAAPDKYQSTTSRSAARARKAGKQRDYFASTPHSPAKAPNGGRLPFGIYQRVGGKVLTILLFVPKANYKPRYDFFGRAKQTIDRHLAAEMRAAMQRAIETAKR